MISSWNTKYITILMIDAYKHTFFRETSLLGDLSDSHADAFRTRWYLHRIYFRLSTTQRHNTFDVWLFYFHHKLVEQEIGQTDDSCDASRFVGRCVLGFSQKGNNGLNAQALRQSRNRNVVRIISNKTQDDIRILHARLLQYFDVSRTAVDGHGSGFGIDLLTDFPVYIDHHHIMLLCHEHLQKQIPSYARTCNDDTHFLHSLRRGPTPK